MKSRFLKIFSFILTFIILLVVIFSILRYLYPQNYKQYVDKYAKEYSLDSDIIYAIIKCESNFNASSLSHAGAIGLMQITPDTFEWALMKSGDKELDSVMLFDAQTNIKYGCYIYSLFIKEFSNQKTALACYNAGRGNVLKWLKDKRLSIDGKVIENIPFDETAKYVSKVKNTMLIYKILY